LATDTADIGFFLLQDLKQEKFVIDVEPSETVCDDITTEITPTPLVRG
jgi:hypothetical protein